MEQAVPFLYPDVLRTCSLRGEARGLEGSTNLGGLVLSKENQAKVARGSLYNRIGVCILGVAVIPSVITVNCLTPLPTFFTSTSKSRNEKLEKTIC